MKPGSTMRNSGRLQGALAMHNVISHDFEEETPEAKARWFQSLPLSERMDMLCSFTDLVLTSNPKIVEQKDAQQASERIRVLSKP